MRARAARVRLRPIKRSDFTQIEGWYDDALALAHAERGLEQRFVDAKESGCDLLAIEAHGGEIIGLLDYRLHEPAQNWQTIVYIGMATGRRGFGYGSEAVRALEAWAVKSHKITSFMAEIAPQNGLALYFWLRVGYHPAAQEETGWLTAKKRERGYGSR